MRCRILKKEGLRVSPCDRVCVCGMQAMLRGLDLIDTDLSEGNATLAFAFSRMAVIDDSTPRGHLRETHLPLEGFLEALCRIAVLKALPTDNDLSAAGSADAGVYLDELRQRDTVKYQQLLLERQVGWGESPPQSEPRCVEHLLALIAHRIELAGGVRKMLRYGIR